jgi:hypothetical protein
MIIFQTYFKVQIETIHGKNVPSFVFDMGIQGKCGCCVNTLTNNQTIVGYVYNTYKFPETKTYAS